jgi:hypothetical protein
VWWLMVGRILAQTLGKMSPFLLSSLPKCYSSKTAKGCFTPKEPSFTINGIYQEMMEWMSSKLKMICVVVDGW